jgi:hypothetical protein
LRVVRDGFLADFAGMSKLLDPWIGVRNERRDSAVVDRTGRSESADKSISTHVASNQSR